MGWIIMIALTLLVGGTLARFVWPDRGVLQFLGAALLLALAGYAWQGRPGLAGAPKPPPERRALPDSPFAQTREDMLGRFDRSWSWMNLAEGYQRRGDTQGGAEILQQAVRLNPRDADLWVGLGNALVVHSDGMMSPAAQLAFSRAAQIAPDHPGPRFFYGLALAQGGNYDEAERIWRELVAAAPAEAPYRRLIEERLQALQQARVTGQIPARPPATETPAAPGAAAAAPAGPPIGPAAPQPAPAAR
jgi:cytochrome c-type biogenesis protein CcmH